MSTCLTLAQAIALPKPEALAYITKRLNSGFATAQKRKRWADALTALTNGTQPKAESTGYVKAKIAAHTAAKSQPKAEPNMNKSVAQPKAERLTLKSLQASTDARFERIESALEQILQHLAK